MRKLFSVAFFVIGLILILAGFGLITISLQLLLYLGLALILLSVIFFVRG